MIFTRISLPAYGVFCLGLILRLIAWANTSVINPDAALYIHQARAIYFGQLDTLFCAQSDLANYPVMIAGSYWLFHDWVFSARFVSFIFGFGTLIPLYFLLKRFFDDRISVLGTLIVAVMPVFVGSSVDIVRDPITWFFVALGLYWFTLALENKSPWFLAWSCLSLIMATWARIEVSLIIGFSLLFLAVRKQERKIKQLVCFLIPVVGLLSVVLGAVLIAGVHPNPDSPGMKAFLSKFLSPFAQYRLISEKLVTTALQNRFDNFGMFLGEARQNMWLIALGSVLNRCLEAFFYPFFFVCAIGLVTARKKFHSDQRLQYLAGVSSLLLLMFYFHVMRAWYLDYRHVCLLIISCAIFIGFGIDKINVFIQNRFHLQENLTIVALTVLIVALPLFKDLKPRDADKRVFKEIGEFLAEREGNQNIIPITTSCSNYRIVSFYAQLNYRGALCPEGSKDICWEYFADNFDHFIKQVTRNNIKYFLWSEKLWSAGSGSIFQAPYADHLKELKRWRHPDTGEMILYEVR